MFTVNNKATLNKVLWIIHQEGSTPSAGYGGRHYYMAKELSKLGYKVYLFSSSTNHLNYSEIEFKGSHLIQSQENFNLVWVKMPKYKQAHSKLRAINWLLFPLKIIFLEKHINEKPDAVLCSSPPLLAFLGAQFLAKKHKAKLVFEVRDIWPLTLIELGGYSPKHPFIRLMQWVENSAYKKSDAVISNLKNSVEHMIPHGLKQEKFSWIPNGFSLSEVSQNISLNSHTASQLPTDKFIVGYAGTLGLANMLDVFIEAASLLKDEKEIVFVIVGQGKEKKNLETLAANKELDNVVFIDPIPKVEIQALLAIFDVCYIGLTKSTLFNFGVSPNKLFDYLYAKKPILYAVCSGNYKPVEETNAGLQIEPQDPQAIANAVLELYKMSPEDRDQMGANGRKAALEQYEYEMLAKKLEKVLFN